MPGKPKTIDAYLATLAPDRRAPLEALRRTIHRALPRAEECISYAMPAFRVAGGIVAGFAATKTGASYYPFSGRTLSALAADLTAYPRTRSALHFSVRQPLASALVRQLLDARMAEIKAAARVKKRAPRRVTG
jgi:uncharacterized protein YdhG (YjbR/CyaY superfamily)